ncbi:glycosyltransferase family 4 protein [Tessaracoccus defluvii]
MLTSVWGAVVLAGLVAVAAPLILRPFLRRFGVQDVPNHRSSHSRPTLRGGGLAPLAGLTLGCVVAIFALGPGAEPEGSLTDVPTLLTGAAEASPLLLVCAIAAATGLLGLVEDLRGLPVLVRAAGQCAAGAALLTVLSISIGFYWMWIPLGALCFAAYVNIANFMDGVNGISSLHGLATGLSFTALGWMSSTDWMVISGLLLATCFITFLPWNLIRPGMFLGDVGSYLLGGAVAAIAITAMATGLPVMAIVAPMAIYVADTMTTLVRRALRGEPILHSHRTHTYQRLTDLGLSHMAVSALVTLLTVVCSLSGLAVAAGAVSELSGALVITAAIVVYLALPRLGAARVARRTKRTEAAEPALLPPDTAPSHRETVPRRTDEGS